LSLEFADIPESRAKKQVIFLNIMHKVKARKSGQLFVKNMLILQHHYAILDLEKLIDIGS